MPRRAGTKQVVNTPLQKGRKSTQRERLLAGMVAAANREGYAGANVSAVIAQAGVSRPTFYDYFEDRDDCFVATVIDIREELLAEIREKVADGPPERAAAAALETMVAFASSQPANARFLMKEALAGAPVALDARDEGIDQTAEVIEDAFKRVPAGTAIPDLPLAAVVGAIHRLLATRLRRGERVLAGLLADLLAWVDSYSSPAGEHRWGTLAPGPAPAPSPFLPRTALRAPQPLGPGRPRIGEEQVAENHRQRIMFATSQVVSEHGYTAATVSEITRRAGVDGREFYRLYGDKQEAFSAVHELGFQYLMAVTAGAFFAGSSWPERIWEAFRAATQSVQANPTAAHVGFVESYAVGPRGIQRVEDSRVAFTIFLQEGYRYDPQGASPSRLALEAIITAIFEISYREARASAQPQTAGLLAQIVHLCLTPFMGVEAANTFIEGKLAGTRKRPTGARAKPSSGRGRKRAAGERRGRG
jgi:TetR/AcrR family transcriptional regulator